MTNSIKFVFIFFLSFFLFACASVPPSQQSISPAQLSELEQGKRFFEEGYYKRAMKMLLPLACDGIAQAQYAVGYMYYYGYGVAQDTDVGYFWIQRAAAKGYGPAKQALELTKRGKTDKRPHGPPKLRYPSRSLQDQEERDLYY